MTSSLVGSEMCIRDSSFAIHRPVGSGPDPGRARAGRLARPENRLEIKAVSYTHLTLPTICSV
eukprot:2884496-Prorocentrum_lima.AAC.1